MRRIASVAAVGSELLTPATSQAFILNGGWIPPGIIIGGPLPPISACPPGATCVMPWTLWNHTPLAIGSSISFSSNLSNASFSLGAGLSGQYSLTLSPVFETSPGIDELQMILASQQQQLATSQHGQLSFNANPKDHYYLLLNGTARQGQSYQMNISAVPEPETWAMLLAGLAIVGVAARRRGALQA